MKLPKDKKFMRALTAGSLSKMHTPIKAAGGITPPAALSLPEKPAKSRLLAVPFKMSVADQRRLVLRIPEVQRHLAWRQRVMFVEAALVLIRNGLSLNKSARALGLSQGWLHSMVKTFQKHGPHALRPKSHKFKSDTSCQFTILIDES